MTEQPAVVVEAAPAEATYPLRQAVLRPHQRLDEVRLPGDERPDAVHLVARSGGGEVVGVASVWKEAPPWDRGRTDAWRLRGMAVAPELRRGGLGSSLLGEILAHVASHGGGLLWCRARVPAVNLYLRAGLNTRGEAFEVDPIGPHVEMWREVAARP